MSRRRITGKSVPPPTDEDFVWISLGRSISNSFKTVQGDGSFSLYTRIDETCPIYEIVIYGDVLNYGPYYTNSEFSYQKSTVLTNTQPSGVACRWTQGNANTDVTIQGKEYSGGTPTESNVIIDGVSTPLLSLQQKEITTERGDVISGYNILLPRPIYIKSLYCRLYSFIDNIYVKIDGRKTRTPMCWVQYGAATLTNKPINFDLDAEGVDLGLSSGTKWAPYNVGALSNGDVGLYFRYADTTGHAEGSGYNFSAYVRKNPIINDQYDPVRANMGKPWATPTEAQLNELFSGTDYEWVENIDNSGVSGMKFMNKSDHSQFIYFPAAGYYYGTTQYEKNQKGYYDSRGAYVSNKNYYIKYFMFNLSGGSVLTVYASSTSAHTKYGFTVRGVFSGY